MRLKEDRSSWRSRSIVRRDFRHDPGLPETEVGKRLPSKKYKTKHVHKYEGRKIARILTRTWWSLDEPVWIDKWVHTCTECGHKTGHGPW